MNCSYCNKEAKNLNSLRQHEIRCNSNPEKIEVKGMKGEANPMFGRIGENARNQYTKAKINNLPIPIVSIETRKKIGEKSKNQTWSNERRNKLSIAMRKAVLDYPESYQASNVNGRCKKIKYSDEIILDSYWELEVVNWFNNNSIKWEKNKKSFPYIWENKVHSYFPDFYLVDLDKYVEVKGYQRDRDLEKWKSLSNLIIIKQKEIKQIKNKTFILKY